MSRILAAFLVLAAVAAVGAAPARAGLPKRPPPAETLAGYEAARVYSEARGGVALLIVQDDAIAFARAPAGQRIASAHPIYSGVKGLLCPLVMAGVEDGRFGLDDATGPAFTAADAVVPVRVRDLLGMTSGLDDARWWLEVETAARAAVPADRYAFARSLAVLQPPGQLFQYSGVHAAALGGFLRAHAIDPRRVLHERLLRPLGIVPRKWSSDAAGQPFLAHGMSLTAEQWARIGMLMRDDGVFQGRRLWAPGRLGACLAGSRAMPAYGLGWWLNASLTAAELEQIPPLIREHLAPSRPFNPGPPDLFAAIGSHDQRMYVVPSRGLVIVRLARRNDAEPFIDAAFLELVLR